MTTKHLLLAGLALALSFCPARAQFVGVSNLIGHPSSSGTTSTISETHWTGSSFTTDSSAASFTINSITLRMKDATVDNEFFAGFRVSIYTNGGDDKPGAPITFYSAGEIGTGEPVVEGDYVYSMGANSLAAATKYWVVASVQTSQPFGVYNANLIFSGGPDAGSTWTLNTYSTSLNAGSTWGFAGPGALLMSVNASAIPEPSTYAALAGAVALGLAAWCRRARGSKA